MSNYDSDPVKVKAVQIAVNAAGYQPPLAVDGVYGPLTAAGVRWFQGMHQLTQDGIIGDQTMAATIAAPPAFTAAVSSAAALASSLIPPVTTLVGTPSVTTPSAPAAAAAQVRPVIHLGGVGAAAAALGPVSVPALAAAAQAGAAAAGYKPPSLLPTLLPIGLGLLGAVGGFFAPLALAVPIRVVGGAVVGGLGGLLGAKALEPAPAAHPATMHGESYFGGEGMFGMDVNFDDIDGSITDQHISGVTAGEIGCDAPITTLRA